MRLMPAIIRQQIRKQDVQIVRNLKGRVRNDPAFLYTYVLVMNSKLLARQYIENWIKHKEHSEPYVPRY